MATLSSKTAFEPLSGARLSYPDSGIVGTFVDVEGEDEGPKAPIYKPASIPPSNPSHRAACIFLHDVAGEGENFTSFASISADYNLPHLQWVFPTAPWNTRIHHPAWFTPTRFSRFSSKLPNPNAPEDEEEILRSVRTVVDIIDDLVKQSVPAKRIVVGGFGQGHCIALLTIMVSKYSGQLGGVIGQCGYLPLQDRISMLREKQGLPKKFVPVPLLIACAMADAYLPRTEFKAQVDKLRGYGYTDATVKICLYPDMSCLDAAMNPGPLKTTLEFLGKVVLQLKEEEGGLHQSLSSQVQKKDEKVAGGRLQKGNRLGRLRRFFGRLRTSTTRNSDVRESAAIAVTQNVGNNSGVYSPSPTIHVQKTTLASPKREHQSRGPRLTASTKSGRIPSLEGAYPQKGQAEVEAANVPFPSGDQITSGPTQSHECIAGDAPSKGQASFVSPVFRSLVERSITAWDSLTYVGNPKEKELHILVLSNILRNLCSIEELLLNYRLFWFFQRKQSFMQQNHFMKWDPDRLDEYILLPVDYGFVNKRDCFFVSHYWRTQGHPDPEGEDFRLVRGDLDKEEWSYVWLDWTCMPQVPRSEAQKAYFKKMLQRIPMIIRDSAYTWRFPDFQPRLWILFEVAAWVLTQRYGAFTVTPDMRPFFEDVLEMKREGVGSIIHRGGYRCTNNGDIQLVTAWLEIHLILFKIVPDVHTRRNLLDFLDKGNITEYETGIEIDKANGIISHNGSIYRFTPISSPTVGLSDTPVSAWKITKLLDSLELDELVAQLSERERTLGPDHPDTLASARDLAEIFIKLRQYREAEELRRRVLASMEKTLGLEHPDTLRSVNQLGAVLHMQQRYDASTPLFHRYLSGMGKLSGR